MDVLAGLTVALVAAMIGYGLTASSESAELCPRAHPGISLGNLPVDGAGLNLRRPDSSNPL